MFFLQMIFFVHETTKTSPIKVGQFSKISVISESFPFCQMAQTEEFMFSNVAYRAIVYGTGICTMHT